MNLAMLKSSLLFKHKKYPHFSEILNIVNYIEPEDQTEEIDLSFINLIDEWLVYHSNEIAESTAYRYETQCNYLREYFANMLLREIDTIKINNLIVDMKCKGYADIAIVNYCKVLSLCFKYAITMKYVSDNPVDDACVPKVPRHAEIYPYSINEIMKLLSIDYLQWVKDGIMIAFHTGMREGEIYALKWTDINFEQRFIIVQRSQSKAGSKVVLKTTKTPSGIRRIDIDTYVSSYLLAMKKRSTSNYVFVSENKNSKYDFRVPWNIAKHVKQMCMMAGIPPRNFHTFRHTHATVLLAYGIHPKIVQERLGHSDISITMEIYSHILPTIQKEAVKTFEKICGKYYGDDGDGTAAALLFDNIINLPQLPYCNEQMPVA